VPAACGAVGRQRARGKEPEALGEDASNCDGSSTHLACLSHPKQSPLTPPRRQLRLSRSAPSLSSIAPCWEAECPSRQRELRFCDLGATKLLLQDTTHHDDFTEGRIDLVGCPCPCYGSGSNALILARFGPDGAAVEGWHAGECWRSDAWI
jgi:hypothetical protein